MATKQSPLRPDPVLRTKKMSEREWAFLINPDTHGNLHLKQDLHPFQSYLPAKQKDHHYPGAANERAQRMNPPAQRFFRNAHRVLQSAPQPKLLFKSSWAGWLGHYQRRRNEKRDVGAVAHTAADRRHQFLAWCDGRSLGAPGKAQSARVCPNEENDSGRCGGLRNSLPISD